MYIIMNGINTNNVGDDKSDIVKLTLVMFMLLVTMMIMSNDNNN